MLWYMKHCNYEKLKPRLIKAGMSHIRNESAEEIAYARDMLRDDTQGLQAGERTCISPACWRT